MLHNMATPIERYLDFISIISMVVLREACAMIVNMLSLNETDFILHVNSPDVELDVDDLDCYNCITLLIRLR
jgi:hypothetical protein